MFTLISSRFFSPIFGITVLAAALRIYNLAGESLWLDEAFVYQRIHNSLTGLLTDWDSHRQGPLFTLIEKGWCAIFGYSEFSMRFPAAVFGILSIPVIYRLGRMLFSVCTANFAALLLAVNPISIHFSQDARPYSLLLLTGLLSIYFGVRVLQGNGLAATLGFISSLTLAFYTHAYAIFLIPFFISLPFLMREKNNRKAYRRSFGLTILLFAPMLTVFARTFLAKVADPTAATAWLGSPTILNLFGTFRQYFMSDIAASVFFTTVGAALIFAIIQKRIPRYSSLLFVILVCLILLPWLIAKFVTPIFMPRYTIIAAGASVLLFGLSLCIFPRFLRTMLMVFILIATFFPLKDYYTKVDKDPWRQSVERLSKEVQRGDLIILNPAWAEHPFNYYFGERDSITVVAPHSIEKIMNVKASPRIWLVTAYKHTPELRTELFDLLRSRADLHSTTHMANEIETNPHALFVGTIDIHLFILNTSSL